MKNKNLVAIALIIIVAVFGTAMYVFNSSETQKAKEVTTFQYDKKPFVREYSPSFGDNEKGIYVVEFIDPECESCAIFNNVIKDFYKQYYKDIKLVVRYLANHKNSDYAIKIIEAARLQDRYLEVLDLVYKKQPLWAQHNNEKPELLMEFLKEVDGLDMEKLKADMQNVEIEKRINLDRVDATTLQVTGTPTIFINGKKLQRLSPDSLEDLYISEAYK